MKIDLRHFELFSLTSKGKNARNNKGNKKGHRIESQNHSSFVARLHFSPLSSFLRVKKTAPIENWISVILSSFRVLQKGKMLKTISGTQKVTGSKVRIAVVLSLGYISAFSVFKSKKKKIKPPIETGSQSVFMLKIRPRCLKIGDFFLF